MKATRGRPVFSTFASGTLFCSLAFGLALALRLLEWPSWQDPEYRLGGEMLLATHDAYHWLAGAEGFGLGAGHPMAELLRIVSALTGVSHANVAFWFPAWLASLVSLTSLGWVWALGSLQAGLAAGLLTCLAPGFLARTLLGYYDTDLVTLEFALLMGFACGLWVTAHLAWPWTRRQAPACPLAPGWLLLLALGGIFSFYAQSWHSVFPYLARCNSLFLACMSLALARKGQRRQCVLASLCYGFAALAGLPGLLLSAAVLLSGGGAFGRWRLAPFRRKLLGSWQLALLLLILCALAAGGEIFTSVLNHVDAYLKNSGDARSTGAGSALVYPSVAQSIIEVQDLGFAALFPYFHPWMEAAMLGMAGFALVLMSRPAAVFLLPLAALALLSTRLGGRMVMFGAPIVGIGLSLPLYWLIRRLLSRKGTARRAFAGTLASGLLMALLVIPFADMIPAMSQGPIINRRHAQALVQARSITPDDSLLWLWWDWGYAAQYFSRRQTIADGARHAGPSLYLPAVVLATNKPRFARQVIRYAASLGKEPGLVFSGLDDVAAQALMEKLASPDTPLVPATGRQFIVVSFEMLRLGFWISNYGNWNFINKSGGGGALSIIPEAVAYNLERGEVMLAGSPGVIYPASISVFRETGLERRDYVREWFQKHLHADRASEQAFLRKRRNISFLFNRVMDEKLAMDQIIFNSLMVQLMIRDPQDPAISPYFRLLYDNVFARVYEVL